MKSSNAIIQSLDRGLEILEYVAEAKNPVSIGELAARLRIDRSSVFRLANTLHQRGLLMHADGSREYVLGSGLWKMAKMYPWTDFLVKLSSDPLKKLAGESGETAHIAIREGTKTIIVDYEMSTQPLSVSMNRGDEGLLHCTSVGKALIMDHDSRALRLLLGPGELQSMTPRTITDPGALAFNLKSSRDRGYTVDNEEYFQGIPQPYSLSMQ